MAVIRAFEIVKREAQDAEEGGRLARYFRVIASVGTDESEILDHPDLPQDYDSHPAAPGYVVKSRRLSLVKGSRAVWEVEAIYDPQTPADDGQRNPLDRAIYETGDVEEEPTILKVDLDGKGFNNSFLDPIQGELPEWERGGLVRNLTRNETGFDPWAVWYAFGKSVCADAFRGAPELCSFLRRMSWQNERDPKHGLYTRVTYTIVQKPPLKNAGDAELDDFISPWLKQFRDCGFMYVVGGMTAWDGDQGKFAKFENQIDPSDLDGDGAPLGKTPGSTTKYFTRRGYNVVSWFGLGLG